MVVNYPLPYISEGGGIGAGALHLKVKQNPPFIPRHHIVPADLAVAASRAASREVSAILEKKSVSPHLQSSSRDMPKRSNTHT